MCKNQKYVSLVVHYSVPVQKSCTFPIFCEKKVQLVGITKQYS